ncbi:MAG TPA: hypothetical protein PKA21_08945 [Kiritimatiellia bacterium]|nr:hypothetical protein [Kiritimatiellia bacterium]HMP35020.1 hypothetical protein [Kiritimatiellia bacterium]
MSGSRHHETAHQEQPHAGIQSEIRHILDALARIEKQVVTTNGRVTSLEKWKYGLLCAVGTLAATKWPELRALLGLMP